MLCYAMFFRRIPKAIIRLRSFPERFIIVRSKQDELLSFFYSFLSLLTSVVYFCSDDCLLENYVTSSVMNIVTTFFNSPFSEQSAGVRVSRRDYFEKKKTLQG